MVIRKKIEVLDKSKIVIDHSRADSIVKEPVKMLSNAQLCGHFLTFILLNANVK